MKVHKESKERQIAFLVLTFNSMLCYGLPTSAAKLKVKHID